VGTAVEGFLEVLRSLWAVPNYGAVLVTVFLHLDRRILDEHEVLGRTKLLLDTCLSRRAEVLESFMERFRLTELTRSDSLSQDPFISYLADCDRYAVHERQLGWLRTSGLRMQGLGAWAFCFWLAGFVIAAASPGHVWATATLGTVGFLSQLAAYAWLRFVYGRLSSLEVSPDFRERRKT
jgi:hypothetical protein